MIYVLSAIAVTLTFTMFHTRQMMLGFPCAIFWALLGGHSYTLSINDWDIYYLLFFASTFGMTIFSILAAYGLRERVDVKADKGEYIDEGSEEKVTYIDEGRGEAEENKPRSRTQRLHDRADARRRTKVNPKEEDRW